MSIKHACHPQHDMIADMLRSFCILFGDAMTLTLTPTPSWVLCAFIWHGAILDILSHVVQSLYIIAIHQYGEADQTVFTLLIAYAAAQAQGHWVQRVARYGLRLQMVGLCAGWQLCICMLLLISYTSTE